MNQDPKPAACSANLEVCVLASGSKGNAIHISDGSTAILVDAGLSGIEIQRRMESRGISPGNLDAILVSHEHSDHIHGVGVLARRFDLPVYINPETEKAASSMGKVQDRRPFECGAAFSVKGLTIHPFSLSHDAADPSGFTIRSGESKIGIATDLGIATGMVKEHLKGCSLLVLEANHDPEMLAAGPYPWPTKQRIKSRSGHLSNEDSRQLLEEIKGDHLRHVVLAHLSETNNTPEKALAEVGLGLNNHPARLTVAVQNRCSDIIRL